MKDFDQRQVAELAPFARHEAVLHFPLFANTFPAAYHYARALKAENRAPDNLVNHRQWSDTLPIERGALEDPTIHLFYATRGQLRGLGDQVEAVRVTLYYPTYFFLDKTARAASDFRRIRRANDKLVLDEEIAKALFQGVEAVEIVSDTPQQAGFLKTRLEALLGESTAIELAGRDSISKVLVGNETRRWRIYFFGAPGTTRLLRQRDLFLPVELERGAFSEEASNDEFISMFETYFCFTRAGLEAADIEELKEAASNYHKRFYRTAAETPTDFENLCLVYNEAAWRLESVAIFDGTLAFAKSIRDHHDYGSDGTEVEISEKNSAFAGATNAFSGDQRLRHLHLGAGPIGLGLALPLLGRSTHLAVVLTRDSKARWDSVKGDGEEIVVRAGTFSGKLAAIRTSSDRFRDVLASWANGDCDILILAAGLENPSEWFAEVASVAETLSIAVGGGQETVSRLLQASSFGRVRPPLFAFENAVHSAIVRLANVKPVLTVIDRICSRVEVVSASEVVVACEPSASVFFSPVDSELPALLEKTAPNEFEVRAVPSSLHFEFYKRRKYWLLNQAHFMLAVFAPDYLSEVGIDVRQHGGQALNASLDGLLGHRDTRIFVETISDLQILRLLVLTKREVLEDIFGSPDPYFCMTELREYRKDVLRRVRKSPDEVGRIFSLAKLREKKEKPRDHIDQLRAFVDRQESAIRQLGIRDRPTIDDFRSALDLLAQEARDVIVSQGLSGLV